MKCIFAVIFPGLLLLCLYSQTTAASAATGYHVGMVSPGPSLPQTSTFFVTVFETVDDGYGDGLTDISFSVLPGTNQIITSGILFNCFSDSTLNVELNYVHLFVSATIGAVAIMLCI